jgi:3-methyladenine DNA glycosylase AlkD
MVYKSNKQLRRLSDKQFAEDIKKYIKSSHEFYGTKVPELRVLAKRLHEEYDLKSFYRVFNRFWKSGYHEERSLAIYALELYKEEFDLETWKFIKTKLKEIKSWDKIDSVSSNIIGEILFREPNLEKEIIIFIKSKNIWFKRIALMSTIPLIKDGNINLAIKMLEMCIKNKEIQIQTAVGILLQEIGNIKPAVARRFILKHMNMSSNTFNIATENMKDIRRLKKARNSKPLNFQKLMFWKE